MTDSTLSRLRRSRPQDTEGRVRLLRARLRAGRERSGLPCSFVEPIMAEPCRGGVIVRETPRLVHKTPCPSCNGTGYRPLIEGVRLGAYLGDEACRAVAPEGLPAIVAPERPEGFIFGSWRHQDTRPLGEWASGLSSWGRMACVRAAVAAGRVAWRTLGTSEGREAGIALDAAEAWVACPCEKHLDAAHDPGRALLTSDLWDAFGAIWWDWKQDPGLHWRPYQPPPASLPDVTASKDAILRFAELTSEATVRTAIREALVPWALAET